MSDKEKSDDEKRIIVDEDWKSQVEKEREKMETDPDDSGSDQGIPPASFETLVSSLATQAMMVLGQVPDPQTNKAIYHPEIARHHIDTLAVIQEKTKGNLTEDESKMIDEVVVQLRQLFLHMESAVAQMSREQGGPGPGGTNSGPNSSIFTG